MTDEIVETESTALEAVRRLTKDLVEAAKAMTVREIRYLVDGYYQLQDFRKATSNQVRACTEAGEPAALLSWMTAQSETLEGQIRRAMNKWTDERVVGRWFKSIIGVGPVISAGLMAHIDIAKAPTVGHIWSFFGLNPNVSWIGKEGAEKAVAEVVPHGPVSMADLVAISARVGRKMENILAFLKSEHDDGKVEEPIPRKEVVSVLAKRPWNAGGKVLAWKLSGSFVMTMGHKDSFYGSLYVQRKEYETKRDQSGGNAPCAEATLASKKFRDKETRETYEGGHLPDGRLDLRARRWVAKLALSHLHEVMFFDKYGKLPPKPYVLTLAGHAHRVGPPNSELVPGLVEAQRAAGLA